jgi:hypothetical protein
VAAKPETPITLVVRRGAVRRFNKLQQQTRDLPVVVTWDRRADEPLDTPHEAEERRQQPSFTWELADFLVVPGEDDPPPAGGDDDPKE